LKPPFAAVNVAGAVTFTANNKGINAGIGSGGQGGFGFVVEYWDVTTQTCAVDDDRIGESIAGVGAPDLTAVIANLAAIETHYIATDGCPMKAAGAVDETTLELLRAHAVAKSDENSMLRCVVVAADKNTVTNSVALVNAVDTNNSERVCIAALEDSPSWEGQIAAALAVARAYGYNGDDDVARPINGVVLTETVAPTTIGDKYTPTERNTLMAGGVTPLVAKDGTNVEVIRMISCRMDVMDPQDITVIEIMDEFRERCQTKCNTYLQNYKLKESGQVCYTNKCVTPDSVKGLIISVAREMEQEDKLQGITAVMDEFVATQPSRGRVNIEVPAPIVPGLHIIDATFNLVLSF
jgi:phage tail sheath gpL-like